MCIRDSCNSLRIKASYMIQNILAIFLKFGNTFLFVFLQLVCLFFIVNHNEDQSAIWSNSSSLISGNLYDKYNNFIEFVNLRDENDKLAKENAELRSRLLKRNFRPLGIDSLIAATYEFIPAVVVNNSINRVNNTLTLNKGSKDGIQRGMGVISYGGVVGVVSHVGKNFCSVNSILNASTNISAIEKRTRSLGVASWNGGNSSIIKLNSVPNYVSLGIGDTILTSGFSTVFPRGHTIGIIDKMNKNIRTGYYDIDVELSNDLSNVEYVNIVKNTIIEEIEELEEKRDNE